MVNYTLKHCPASDEKTEDCINVCMRLLCFAFKNGGWKSDNDSYIQLIATLSKIAESNPDFTARFFFIYFDVEKLLEPFQQSDNPPLITNFIKVIGCLVACAEPKVVNSVHHLYPDLHSQIYFNYIQGFLLQVRKDNIWMSDEEKEMFNYALRR